MKKIAGAAANDAVADRMNRLARAVANRFDVILWFHTGYGWGWEAMVGQGEVVGRGRSAVESLRTLERKLLRGELARLMARWEEGQRLRGGRRKG